MALNNPVVGSKGLWKLNKPFDSLLPVNTALTCTAISNYGQLHAMGIDPYETYYLPHDISKEDYQKHFDGDGRIVFLRTDSGIRYSFPLHYLDTYPIGTGINYVSMGVGVRLGAVPVNVNLELLLEQIRELCHLNVGVEVQAEFLALSEIMMVDNAEHDRLENARAARKKSSTPALERIATLINTDKEKSKKLRIAEEMVITQYNYILALEALLKNNNIALPPKP